MLGLLGCCHRGLLGLDRLGQLLVSLHAVLLRPAGNSLRDTVPSFRSRSRDTFQSLQYGVYVAVHDSVKVKPVQEVSVHPDSMSRC